MDIEAAVQRFAEQQRRNGMPEEQILSLLPRYRTMLQQKAGQVGRPDGPAMGTAPYMTRAQQAGTMPATGVETRIDDGLDPEPDMDADELSSLESALKSRASRSKFDVASDQGDTFIPMGKRAQIAAATAPGETFTPPQVAQGDSLEAEVVDIDPGSVSHDTANASDYVVQKGDTLWDIAKKVYGDGNMYKQIAAMNKISNPNKIYAGQTLRVPKGMSLPRPRGQGVSSDETFG